MEDLLLRLFILGTIILLPILLMLTVGLILKIIERVSRNKKLWVLDTLHLLFLFLVGTCFFLLAIYVDNYFFFPTLLIYIPSIYMLYTFFKK